MTITAVYIFRVLYCIAIFIWFNTFLHNKHLYPRSIENCGYILMGLIVAETVVTDLTLQTIIGLCIGFYGIYTFGLNRRK